MKTTTMKPTETNYPKIIMNTAFVFTIVMMVVRMTPYVNFHWGYNFVPVVGSLVGMWLYCYYLVNFKK